jgi:lipopolysaccharide export system permease protein
LIRTVGQAASGIVAPQDVVLILGFVALGHLPTMLSLSLFVAVVITLGRMYRDSEMAIWFASGVGLTRFLRPLLRMAWPVLLVVALLMLVAWPWGNRNSQELRTRYQQRSDLMRVAPGAFQTSSDGRRVFFIERAGADGTTARNVFILTQTEQGESVTSARSGRFEFEGGDRFLVLEHGQRNDIDRETGERSLSRFERYRVVVGERATATPENRQPKLASSWDLLSQPTPRNMAEMAWRFGLMLATANLLLLGVGLSATNPRRAGNWNLLQALLAYFTYINLVNFSQGLVGSGRASLGTALLAVHGSVFGLALALLWWRDHAACTRARGAATAAPQWAAA